MVGFVVGALFAPEAYQFFPYFAVAYTSTLLAIIREQEGVAVAVKPSPIRGWRFAEVYGSRGESNTLTPVR
jgi:hypothetical protein